MSTQTRTRYVHVPPGSVGARLAERKELAMRVRQDMERRTIKRRGPSLPDDEAPICAVCRRPLVEDLARHPWQHRTHIGRVAVTYDLARAAGTDAANANMRANGRDHWNEEDLNAATVTMNRLLGDETE